MSVWVLIPPTKPQTSIFFVPQALKNLTSPPTLTKSPDNSNVLHMFHNNTYFRTDYIRYSRDLTNMAKTGQDQHLKPSEPYFIFKRLFLTKNVVSPMANIHSRNFKSPRYSYFCDPPFSKFETKVVHPSRKGRGGLYCVAPMS